MRRLGAAAAAALLLAPVGAASAQLRFGVADETGKYADDGGAGVYSALHDLGMTEDRFTIRWDATQPQTIPEQQFLDRSVPVAAARGVRIIFDIYPLRADAITSSPGATDQFASFLQLVARTYSPSVVIVGNESNQGRFWQPQFDASGKPVAGAAYEAFLAQSYDALKAVNPAIDVVAGGPSNRGNDNPNAPDNVSTSPVRFIHDLGVAYRQSGRTKPIMDQLGFHPYPLANDDPVTKNYQWPSVGVADLARLRQAIWDAFHETAQPTFAENGGLASADALTLVIDEIGWQVGVVPGSAGAYSGAENVTTIDEPTQAKTYSDLVHLVSCEPGVTDLLLFQLIDQSNLETFQSGLFRADWSIRPSYGSMKTAIGQTGGNCVDRPVGWQHVTNVTGARAGTCAPGAHGPTQSYWSFLVGAEEEATYRAGIFRIGAGPATSLPARLDRSLAGAGGMTAALVSTGGLRPYVGRLIHFPSKKLKPGRYVCAARLAATMNTGRSSTVVGKPFTVYPSFAAAAAARRRGG
jgi:hypothetical protein